MNPFLYQLSSSIVILICSRAFRKIAVSLNQGSQVMVCPHNLTRTIGTREKLV